MHSSKKYPWNPFAQTEFHENEKKNKISAWDAIGLREIKDICVTKFLITSYYEDLLAWKYTSKLKLM